MRTTTLRAVTFDCWGTLLTDTDFPRATERRIQVIGDLLDLDPDGARDLLERGWRVHHDAWTNVTQYGSPGIARWCVEALGRDGDDGLVERLCAGLEDAGVEGGVEPLPGAVDSLARLRDAGVRTALVCDTGFTPGRVVRRFLDDFGLGEHLEFLAFSNEVGVPKPDPRMFQTALDAISSDPAEAAHVGDLRRTDIAGARAVGMATVRIAQTNDDSSEHPEADAVVTHHSELPGALRRLGADL